MKHADLSRILGEARHERAAAERMAECAQRIGNGEAYAEPEWITATILDLRATLGDWRDMARSVEAIPDLSDVAAIHADIRRLMSASIEDLERAQRRTRA